MKKGLIIIIGCLLLLLNACNRNNDYNIKYEDYKGKDISYIEYTTIDYSGGYKNQKKLNLETNELLVRSLLSEETEYEIIHTYRNEDEKRFLDGINGAGLFDLKAEYSPLFKVLDGGGWTLLIEYVDGTKKESKGENAGPYNIFKKADYSFYELYGDDFFNQLDDSYKNPPSIDISMNYDNIMQGYGLSASNYKWNKNIVTNINNIIHAKQKQSFEYKENLEYKFILSTANYKFKFNNMLIKSYDLNGNDEKAILNSKWFKQKEFALELNRIYVITIEFEKYGTCEYPFATRIFDKDEVPSDFSFVLTFGSSGKYKYDSKDGLVTDGNKTIYEKLSDDVLKEIYFLTYNNHFKDKEYLYNVTGSTEHSDEYISFLTYYRNSGHPIALQHAKITDDMSFYKEARDIAIVIQQIYKQYLEDIFSKLQ